MKPNNAFYLALGTFIGVGVVFYQVDAPKPNKCETYKVASKSVTAFVLKPPPAPPADPVIIKEKCPAPSVSPKAENDTQPDLNGTDDTQKPRRHRRHRHRWWR